MSASTFDTFTAARAIALVLACLALTGCATMTSGSRIGTIDGVTPLHAAAFAAQVPLIKALLADGARVNAKAENDVTPLHEAALAGHPAAFEALLAAGASANTTTNRGEGPLHVAHQGMAATESTVAPYLEAIEILKAHGAR